jgi:hypothetical protein
MSGARQYDGRKIVMKRLVRGEKGYVLIAALLVLLVLGLISGPLLSYMVSGLRAGHIFETGAAELYSADAGVEDAVWRIPNAGLCPGSPTTHYTISDVNGKSVDVTVTLTNNVTGILTYKITSIAVTYDSGNTAALASGTIIESYLLFTPGGELDIFSGALASETSIDLAKDSAVYGDIYHCGAFDNSIIINDPGGWVDKGCGEFPDQSENLAFANTFKALAMAGTTYQNGLTIDTDRPLGPAYIIGDLDINMKKAGSIVLNGIVYVTGKINVENGLTVTGTGSIIAEGDINFKMDLTYSVTGDSIIMSLNGGIDIDKAPGINALLYAPNGLINFKKEALVTGGVVGARIDVDKEGSFTFVPKTSWDFPGGLPGAYTIETYDVSRLS